MSDAALARLLAKYEEIAALRADFPASLTKQTAVGAHRARLQVLAREFPGALRQLECLHANEITGRIASLRTSLENATPHPAFAALEVRYHQEMKNELTQRGSATKSSRVLQRLAVELESSAKALEAILFGGP